jgi:hypothetical protein
VRRYVILVRYSFRSVHTALKVARAEDGTISCVEPSFAGATWRADGRYVLTTARGAECESRRRPLFAVAEPLVVYSIPGARLLDETMFPRYDSIVDRGATIQVDGEDVLEAPNRVTLQILLVGRGEEPPHRETVGDRRIDEGEPDIWVVLDRARDDPPGRLAVAVRIPPRVSPLTGNAHPSEEGESE